MCYFPINCFNYGEFFFGRGRKRNVDLKKTRERRIYVIIPQQAVRSFVLWRIEHDAF